jgi:hypothetical protein
MPFGVASLCLLAPPRFPETIIASCKRCDRTGLLNIAWLLATHGATGFVLELHKVLGGCRRMTADGSMTWQPQPDDRRGNRAVPGYARVVRLSRFRRVA